MTFSLLEKMWFGDFDDEEAEAKAAESLAATLGKLQGVLPVPTVAARLISVVNNPDYKATDVSDLIAGDAGLSSRILRMINSPAYSLRAECRSISHAVVLLGPKTIRDTAIALSLLGMFKDESGHGQAIMEHSAVVGGLAQRLGRDCPRLRNIDVFTCGLLHDIGKLLQLQVDDDYAELLATCTGSDQMHLAERERYGYDHAVLAGQVLSSWKIPEPIPTAVAWHHQAQRAYDKNDETAAIVAAIRLADFLAYELPRMEASEDEMVVILAKRPAAAYLDLQEEEFREMLYDLYAVSRSCRESLAA